MLRGMCKEGLHLVLEAMQKEEQNFDLQTFALKILECGCTHPELQRPLMASCASMERKDTVLDSLKKIFVSTKTSEIVLRILKIITALCIDNGSQRGKEEKGGDEKGCSV